MTPFHIELQELAARLYRRLMRHRERYLRAWVAETGIKPSEAMLVERKLPDGSTSWTIERRPTPW